MPRSPRRSSPQNACERLRDSASRVVTVDAGWFGAPGGTYWPEQRGDWDCGEHRPLPRRSQPRSARRSVSAGPCAGIWVEAEAVGAKAVLRRASRTAGRLRDAPARHVVPTTAPCPSTPTTRRSSATCASGGAPAAREYVAGHPRPHRRRDRRPSGSSSTSTSTRTPAAPAPTTGMVRGRVAAPLPGPLRGARRVPRAATPRSCSRRARPGVCVSTSDSPATCTALFLSDPDYTEHHRQVLWAFGLMLPPVAMLHWSWSQWRGDTSRRAWTSRACLATSSTRSFARPCCSGSGISMRLPGCLRTSSRHPHGRRAVQRTIAPFVAMECCAA